MSSDLDLHVRIIAGLNLAFGGLALLAALFFLAMATVGLAIPWGFPLSAALMVMVLAVFLMGALPLFAGIGLLQRTELGRILGLIVGAVSLLNFPIGTAFGVYSLVVLLKWRPGATRHQQQQVVVEYD